MKRARHDAADNRSSSGLTGGQPKIPRISRKIRACQECQNRKIKCGIEPGQSQCSRCARMGLQCVVNKSLQTLLDGENEWKSRMESQFRALYAAVVETQRALDLPQLPPFEKAPVDGGQGLPPKPSSVPDASSSRNSGHLSVIKADITAMTRENSPRLETQSREDEGIVSAPMESLFEVTKLRNIRSDPGATAPLSSNRDHEPDFIAQGKLSLQDAEELFSTFQGTLNAYLWGGISLLHDSLAATRASSGLLTAAILTVTALHARDNGRSFDICYPIFLELTSQSLFARYHTLDDIRGLCIGAFWLSDMSWKLSGLAVRIATELNLHQFSAETLRDGKPERIERARLWYFLYVCDHHFSIAYGRPPVISENATITSHESVLKLPGVTQSDFRLHSQVAVFIILSRVFHTFGSDRNRLIASDEFEALRRYDVDLGLWREHWETRLDPDEHLAQYPAKGVVLHYHFARLQLFSTCLRGLSPSGHYTISSERRHFIDIAITSASCALELILDDSDMGKAVVGVPLYLLTTIAYACLFLTKISQWKLANFNMCHEDVILLLERTVDLLHNTRHCVHHVGHYIGKGLSDMLKKLRLRESEDSQSSQANQPEQQWTEMDPWNGQEWQSWMVGDMDLGDMGAGQEFYPFNMLDVLNSQMPL
ncbi:hypothetical protein G7046_g6518 [Stylonectria norvegica]|nr:hypothetical protein G7046_g6518 [Stylonectria norvegica]